MSEPRPVPRQSWWRILVEQLGAIAVCGLLMIWLMGLWRTDLRVPFDYAGDSHFYSLCVHGLMENGWYWHHDRVGAPFDLDLRDFPATDNLHFLLIRALAVTTSDAFLVNNLFFLLTFPLSACTALAVLRHFGCSYPASLVAANLFAFLPGHFFRGQAHLFLSAYYMVPPMALVVLWVYRGEPLFRAARGKTILAVLICALTASAGVYYAFFGCFFLAVAGLAGRFSGQRPAARAAALSIGVVLLLSIANLAPSLVHARAHGSNGEAARRNMGEAETYGLRLSSLLMPITGHRIPFVAWLKHKFNAKIPLVTENDFASLGLAGSAGFVFLLLQLLARRSRETTPSTLEGLCILNLFGVLLATIGGFGLLCAAALPQIRGYNRISVYLGFFALFAVALLLDAAARRWATTPARRAAYLGMLALMLIAGAFDQTPACWAQRDPQGVAGFHQDAAFISQIEQSLPPGAMIFQLPFCVFPEGTSYDHLRGYLHSRTLRWSFPAMRGREAELWQRTVSDRDITEMLPCLAFAGFDGVFIDRQGFSDGARALETKLGALLGGTARVHTNQRFVFYPMSDYVSRLREQHTAAQWQVEQERALHPVAVVWSSGFVREHDVSSMGGRWCAPRGEMFLHNFADAPREVALTLGLQTAFPQPTRLRIDGPSLQHETTVSASTRTCELRVTVPPGRHKVTFQCDGPGAGGNPRRIFKVVSCLLREDSPEQLVKAR